MTKRLFLLRHAQALSSDGEGDEARRLSPKGLKDAQVLGTLMKKKGYAPDIAYCSPALRTRQTLEGILKSLPSVATSFPAQFYNGNENDLLTTIRQSDESANSILIVAHNPGIHALAATLAQEGSSPALINRLIAGYAPGTLTVLECPCSSWTAISRESNPLLDYAEATDYNAPATPARWT